MSLNKMIAGKCLLLILVSFIIISFVQPAHGQSQTVGLFVNDTSSYNGYTLFSYSNSEILFNDTTYAYMIDNFGRLVHKWKFDYVIGWSAYLLENGDLLAFTRREYEGEKGAHIFRYDWDGNILWEWEDNTTDYYHHHDFEPLPNGNVLILVQDYRTKVEVDSAGRDTTLMTEELLWSEAILEIEPTGPNSGDIVWEWYIFDHLIQDIDSTKANYGVVEDHPELMDANWPGGGADWLHANGVDYNADLDQIVISFRTSSEIWVIDHSTTNAEAAGHTGGNSGKGGDLLYRWGNPSVYRRGDSSDQKLSKQHDANWIAPGLPGEGNILVFNNGNDWGFSSIDEIVTPVDMNGNYDPLGTGEHHGPTDPVWTYVDNPPESLYAPFVSGARRLPNGNTVICKGPVGEFREVTPAGDIVWFYINPIKNDGPIEQGNMISNNLVFRCYRYGPEYPGLAGRDLTPTTALESYPVTVSGTGHWPNTPSPLDPNLVITSTLTPDLGITTAEVVFDTGAGALSIPLYDDGMHDDGTVGDGLYGAHLPPPSDSTFITYYINLVDDTGAVVTDPPNPPETLYFLKVGFACGNVDGLSSTAPMNILDLNYLVNYIFRSGPPPPDLDAANVDGITIGEDNKVNILDLAYTVNFIFRNGPEPVCE